MTTKLQISATLVCLRRLGAPVQQLHHTIIQSTSEDDYETKLSIYISNLSKHDESSEWNVEILETSVMEINLSVNEV
jgi:hypothetical protein